MKLSTNRFEGVTEAEHFLVNLLPKLSLEEMGIKKTNKKEKVHSHQSAKPPEGPVPISHQSAKPPKHKFQSVTKVLRIPKAQSSNGLRPSAFQGTYNLFNVLGRIKNESFQILPVKLVF